VQGLGQVLTDKLGGDPKAPATRGAGQGSVGLNIDVHILPHLSAFVQGGFQFGSLGPGAAPFLLGLGYHSEKQW
jgi:hypothetical protein